MYRHFRNVNDAFDELVHIFQSDNYPVEQSRNGPVTRRPHPIFICYERPIEQCLFVEGRGDNPFLHLADAAWCLAGRNDLPWLEFFAKRMADFSDDGRTLNGAYGYRWRTGDHPTTEEGFDTDQLQIAIESLKANPESRRIVIAMYLPEDLVRASACYMGEDGNIHIFHEAATVPPEKDLPPLSAYQKGFTVRETTLLGRPCHVVEASKDIPCNTEIILSVKHSRLDMTIINRSNDLIWGLLGANYVQFSTLHQYLATATGIPIGRYYHFSNDLHAYLTTFTPVKWMPSDTIVYTDVTARPAEPLFSSTDWTHVVDEINTLIDWMTESLSGPPEVQLSLSQIHSILLSFNFEIKSEYVRDLLLPATAAYAVMKLEPTPTGFARAHQILDERLSPRYWDWALALHRYIDHRARQKGLEKWSADVEAGADSTTTTPDHEALARLWDSTTTTTTTADESIHDELPSSPSDSAIKKGIRTVTDAVGLTKRKE